MTQQPPSSYLSTDAMPEEDDDGQRPTVPPSQPREQLWREQLCSRIPQQRALAVSALGRAGTLECVALLSDCLFDPDVDVLHEAAKALARIGSLQAIDRLVQLAADERAAVARRVVAAFALAEVRAIPNAAVDVLHALANGSDPWLAATARESLVRLMRY